MDLRDSPEEAAFRAEVRAWIAANLPDELRGHRGGAQRFEGPELRAWSRALSDAGYVGLTWPEEYGGRGAPYEHQAILYEEMAAAEAPPHVGVIGLGMAGPTIIAHGTEEQKTRYLSKILSAEEIWCQGFSEPDAGSDLASARAEARRDGDDFVVNGQKVWSSYAHIADFCILVTRSDPEAPRYRNLTYLILDMHAPGVEVRPLRQITGEAEFNEIFMEEAEIPDENVVGEVGGGWQVAITTLMFERAGLGAVAVVGLRRTLEDLVVLVRERGLEDDPLIRQRIAEFQIGIEAMRLGALRTLTATMKTGIPGPEGSLGKWQWATYNQAMTEMASEVAGTDGVTVGTDASYRFLRSRANSIEGGTTEVLQNIIAERVLGLPRLR